MKKIISDETKHAVVTDYRNSSMTMDELCEKYSVSAGSIHRWDKIIPDTTSAVIDHLNELSDDETELLFSTTPSQTKPDSWLTISIPQSKLQVVLNAVMG